MGLSTTIDAAGWRRAACALASALIVALIATPAIARLQSQTPKGIDLRGHWQLDPARSDDAKAVREAVRKALERERMPLRGPRQPPPIRRPDGGLESEGAGAVGGEHDDDAEDRSRRVSRWLRENEGFLASFDNPAELELDQRVDGTLRLHAGEDDTSCAPGERVAVTTLRGTTERSCGWEGRAFVVRLKPKERGAQRREDRYELDPTARRLVWTTSWTKGDLPDLRLRREYLRR